jgi:hypothetical protein
MSLESEYVEQSVSGGKKQGAVEWAKRRARQVDYEDSVTLRSSREIWASLYAAAGATNEQDQEDVRMAVYEYCALNGTSREGNYAGRMKTAGGKEFAAVSLAHAATKGQIRRFMRGNMRESYVALKESGALMDNARFMAKVAQDGVPADAYMAECDWMTFNPMFTPLESVHNARLFSVRRDAAEKNRGGSLELIENSRFKTIEGVRDDAGSEQDGGRGVL